jgi:hypothetical protein
MATIDEFPYQHYDGIEPRDLAKEFQSRAKERGGIWDEVVNSYTVDDVAAVIREFKCKTIVECFRAFQPLIRK